MPRYALTAAWLMLVVVGGCDRGSDPKLVEQEIASWQGRWQCVSRIQEGTPISAEEAATINVTVGGTLYHFRWGKFDEFGRYTFRPEHDPKVLEVAIESPPEMAGMVIPAIYRIDGDELTIAHREDLTIPKDFTSEPDTGQTVEIWKRVHP